MREETRIAVEACLEAFAGTATEEEKDLGSLPSYPFPAAMAEPRAIVLAEIERLRTEGNHDRRSMSGLTVWAESWAGEAGRQADSTYWDFFARALELLFVAGDMSPAEFEALIGRVPRDFERNFLRGRLVHRLLTVEHDVAEAERVSETFEPLGGEDQRFVGHRLVAFWFAEQGDVTAFFARWRRLAAGKERHHLGRLKEILVQSASRAHGWQAALAATGDKRLGPKYRQHAFHALVENGEVDQLHALFGSPEGAGLLTELDELTVLVGALHTKASRTGVAMPEPFRQILTRVIAVEPSPKAAMRLRDGLMQHLWPAYPDAETLARARKAVRTPGIKRDLKELDSTVLRPGDVPAQQL